MGQLYLVGAHFEALLMGVLMAASDFSCNFFRILTSGFEQCVPFPGIYEDSKGNGKRNG